MEHKIGFYAYETIGYTPINLEVTLRRKNMKYIIKNKKDQQYLFRWTDTRPVFGKNIKSSKKYYSRAEVAAICIGLDPFGYHLEIVVIE